MVGAKESATRIVEINKQLGRKLPKPTRLRLTAEQAQIWEAEFPGTPFEQVAEIAKH